MQHYSALEKPPKGTKSNSETLTIETLAFDQKKPLLALQSLQTLPDLKINTSVLKLQQEPPSGNKKKKKVLRTFLTSLLRTLFFGFTPHLIVFETLFYWNFDSDPKKHENHP